MKVFLKSVIIIYFSVSVINADTINIDEKLVTTDIDLTINDGQGSLLLTWEVPDSVMSKEVYIYVKEFGQKEFQLLSTISANNSKFLYSNCIPDTRYFFKIKIIDVNESVYFSDIITPHFGTCLPYSGIINYDTSHISVADILYAELMRKLENQDIDIDFESIFDLIDSDLSSRHNWIETFPLVFFNSITPVIPLINDIMLESNIFENIMNTGSYYSNQLYLSPTEWERELNFEIDRVKQNWKLLYAEFPFAQDLFQTIEPIRIIGARRGIEKNITLDLFVFHPEQLDLSELFLLFEDEYIDLQSFIILDSNSFSIIVPDYWNYVDIIMDDIFIQHCPLMVDSLITYTLNGDIIPFDVHNPLKVENEKTELWLNEITWNSHKRNINVELAAKSSLQFDYFISFNDSVIWNFDPLIEFKVNYFDSSFTLSPELDFPTILSLNSMSYDGNQRTLEYIVLDSIPFAISRMPDGGDWHYSEAQTSGLSNNTIFDDYSKSMVPELFVLYQNYPNPFNGQTKISFDLIENAIISLFVSDATGRIYDKLLDSEYVNSGTYSYLWNGEGHSTGIYFVTLQAQVNEIPPTVISRKMLYLK